jgi:hypothetical protein
LQDSGNLNDLKDILLRYSLVNTVQSPTRITKSMSMLKHVMIMNKKFYTESSIVIDVGLSDHHAQMLPVVVKNYTKINQRILKRQFGEF